MVEVSFTRARGARSLVCATLGINRSSIAGGGATILEYVNASLIDEFSIALSPVLFGSGIRLFEGVDAGRAALEPVRAEPTQRVTHLTYAVRER
jgi:dihydrofolate reductase